jgi:hypothetical protein
MIWLTWRQFRTKALVIYAALAVVAVLLAITGPQLTDLYRASSDSFVPSFAADKFKRTVYFAGFGAVYLLPAIVGAFWGAPLVARDLEEGTHRLAWNQSITRNRWLATKLGFVALAAIGAGLISLAVTWWCAPFDKTVNGGYRDGSIFAAPRLTPALFGARGIVPIGFVVLAFVIGVTAGLVIRRTVPAMAVTLASIVALQILVPLYVQAHLVTPNSLTATITHDNVTTLEAFGPDRNGLTTVSHIGISIDEPGAWITSNKTIDSSGRVVTTLPPVASECSKPSGPGQESEGPGNGPCFSAEALTQAGYRQRVEYVPANRFWALQSRETGVLLSIAALLAGFCFWRIRRV